ncbi:aromatic-ring-hydroxylating dioxygenase subunit beta [Pseudonocardia sp. RS010]|uniref:aromatic-ring-hydroxylating dioxygenase subunit beta n=1 Tax=Pseudonocardia sp. RS010 TaxID=3385979 RepID=UPI00399F642B
MTTALEPDIRTIEQFLFREARLADEHHFDEWESLWTDDGLYWVPANADDIDPMTQMSIIHDNRSRIRTRIKQLNTGRRLSQEPRSRLRRVVSNVELLGEREGDVEVGANFVLVESRERGKELWAGRYTYRLRIVDGELRMSYKKVALVDNARAISSLSFLI